jgi:hypothetical protein
VPAAAVIPAPIAYIIDVAVKMFVVDPYLLRRCVVSDVPLPSVEIVQTASHVSCGRFCILL